MITNDCHFFADAQNKVRKYVSDSGPRTDPLLSKVVKYIMTGWPHHVDDVLKLFKMKELEWTVEDGCVLWGRRVVIPAKHQDLVLNELHSGLGKEFTWILPVHFWGSIFLFL